MQLTTCPSCHRHVAITETTCPFCRNAVEGVAKSSRIGRVSRAAVFAGAALATAACGKKAKPPQQQTASPDAAPPDAAPEVSKPDPNNIPMPYGAPPARRRVV